MLAMIENNQNKEKTIDGSFIRTMAKDMSTLKGGDVHFGESKIEEEIVVNSPSSPSSSPPSSLPVIESAGKHSFSKPKEEIRDIKPILEKAPKKDFKEKEKKLNEDITLLSRIKLWFNSQPSALKSNELKPEIKKVLKVPLPKPLIKPKTPEVTLLNPLIKPRTPKVPSKSVFGIIIIVVILVIGGLGGFFYWWNYLKTTTPPLELTHYECQDNQCIITEGQGDNQCQINQDCQPAKPVILVPDSLIPDSFINETKTIELVVDQENLLLDQLKTLISQEQASSTLNHILVRITDQKYLSLNDLILALNISIPEAITTSTSDDYTLFSYNQSVGNRLGLVIKMGRSETLVQDLSNWETTIKDNLKQLFLTKESPSAAEEKFQDNVYKDIQIRYMNFPTPNLSIDYALIKGNLVIATSRESMFAIIDALMAIKGESKNTENNCAQIEETCGGIAGILCCDDSTCHLDGDYPDASGTCSDNQQIE